MMSLKDLQNTDWGKDHLVICGIPEKKQVKYISKKDNSVVVRFEVRKSARELFGVNSMPDWAFLVGIGEDNQVYPICFAEDDDKKNEELIQKVIKEYFIEK